MSLLRPEGIFVTTLAAFGVVEAQKRNTLHYHFQLYGSLSLTLLQKSAEFPVIANCIANILNEMYNAEFPRHMHVQQLLQKYIRDRNMHNNCRDTPNLNHIKISSLLQKCPSPSKEPHSWYQFCNCANLQTNLHQHTFRCKNHPEDITNVLLDSNEIYQKLGNHYNFYHGKKVYETANKEVHELPPMLNIPLSTNKMTVTVIWIKPQ